MNRITLTIGGRVVYWDVEPNVMAYLAQNLVASLGPAEEDVPEQTAFDRAGGR